MIQKIKIGKGYETNPSREIKLHPDILHILYENMRYVTKSFREVIGFYNIDHIAIAIINPFCELVVFSTTPNIEYNLISQGLWKYDYTISLNPYENSLIWWDRDNAEPYFNKLLEIKQKNNNYTFGMSLAKEMDDFCILYSFATKNENKENIKSYYLSNIEGLSSMGDHCYKTIRDIYSFYCTTCIPPTILSFSRMIRSNKHKSSLRLITNNAI